MKFLIALLLSQFAFAQSVDLGASFGSGGGGSGVSSLNALTGDINLLAGTGITIGVAGQNITIGTVGGAPVTAVTASSPLFSSGGSAPNITCQTASSSLAGCLLAVDWNTFNNKQPAGNYITALTGDISASGPGSAAASIIATSNSTLTTLSALSLPVGQLSGRGNLTDAGTDGITITSGTNALANGGASLSQHVADASHNGYLSSADWSTFNGKQPAGNYITALTGDATASGPGSVGLTLATVNSNVGSFGDASHVGSFTVNGKGLITAASSVAISGISPSGAAGGDLTGTYPNPTIAALAVTNAKIANATIDLTAKVTGALPVANGGTSQITAPLARGPSGLNIDERTTFSNANYNALSTDRYIAQIGTMSATRTLTLPPANSVNPGQVLNIVDESGTVSTVNNIIIAPNGADTINNSASSSIMRTPYGRAYIFSDGVSNWTDTVIGISRGGTGLTTLPTNGQILIGNGTNSNYTLTTLTAGTGITVTNGSGSITVAATGVAAAVTKSANYTILSSDSTIFCDTSGGAFNLTLPTPSGMNGKIYRIFDTKGTFSTNNLTLVRFGSEKLSGLAASKVFQTDWGAWTITTDGTDWYVQ